MIAGQAALLHTDGWTWEEMEINRSAAMVLNFPSAGGRGGRGAAADAVRLAGYVPQCGQRRGNAQRAVLDQIAKLNAFFDDARKYKTAKAANLPDFRKDLRFEAMLPVIDGKMPLAVNASRAGHPRRHCLVRKAERENRDYAAARYYQGRTRAQSQERSRNPRPRPGSCRKPKTPNMTRGYTQPLEAYKAGVKFALGTFTNEFVRDLPYQAATAVAYGLPHDEAMKALTINPAQSGAPAI